MPKEVFVSGTFLFSHELSDKLNYGVNLRQEIVSDYQNPFLFSLNSSYKVAKNYIININGSKNHRVPTFNDLYCPGQELVVIWRSCQKPLAGGNWTDNRSKKITLSLNAYSITTDNLIQWRPNTQGVWMADECSGCFPIRNGTGF